MTFQPVRPSDNPATDNQALLDLLTAYRPMCPIEAAHQETLVGFVASHHFPFSRSHLKGHLTASALVVNTSATHLLLGFHRKLGKWLQFGGHGEEGETNPLDVAVREAREESGIRELEVHPSAPAPYDLDVHTIPARPDVPEHSHLDIRFLFLAPDDATTNHQVDEQEKVQWFTWGDAAELDLDESLRRMLTKARALTHP